MESNDGPTIAAMPQDRRMQVYHPLGVRLWHWINAGAFFALVVSGAMILWVLPELYWGEDGYFGHPSVISFPLEPNQIYSALGRNTHFLAAWIFVLHGAFYAVYGVLSGHFRRRLLLSPRELCAASPRQTSPTQTFRAPQDATPNYTPPQKASYALVIFVLFPTMLLTGLTMSPGILAAHPWLLDLWGGRQSARTIHFFVACSLVLFLFVHLLQSFRRGFGQRVGGMITGKPMLAQREDNP